jgi:hypothetical protein
MLHDDALHRLNTLRLRQRLKLKRIPTSITHELIEPRDQRWQPRNYDRRNERLAAREGEG